MKSYVLIPAFAALVISGCTSAYKSGQTPDDVYYSPTRPQDEYVQTEKRDDRHYQGSDEYYEDRYLRMRVQNRYRWSPLDDYYFNSPYAYNSSFYGSGWNSPYNSYWCWNNYYNPYYSGYSFYPYNSVIFVKNPVTYTRPSRPLAFNSSSYNTSPVNNQKISNSYYNPRSTGSGSSRYNNSNRNGSSTSNSLRKIFSNSNSDDSYSPSRSSSSTPSRSYTPSSSSSSSSSGSRSSGSSSSGGSSRPSR